MSAAPTVRLVKALPMLPPMREKLPNLAERFEALGGNPDEPTPHRVFATRDLARRLVEDRQDVGVRELVFIDAKGAEVVSPPFADEILKAWPYAELVRANQDIQETWNFVKEHHRKTSASDDKGERS